MTVVTKVLLFQHSVSPSVMLSGGVGGSNRPRINRFCNDKLNLKKEVRASEPQYEDQLKESGITS